MVRRRSANSPPRGDYLGTVEGRIERFVANAVIGVDIGHETAGSSGSMLMDIAAARLC